MKIYQIYYKDEQKAKLDPAFTPWDNTANLQPDLQEWYIWDKIFPEAMEEKLDYWGAVSWKFGDKTNLSGQQFVDFIQANPGYDVYFVNPAVINEAVFLNGWEQGDIWHPNLSKIATEFFTKIGYTDPGLRDTVIDRNVMMFASYFVASREFWQDYMKISSQLFTEAEKDPEFRQKVFGQGLSEYNLNKSLPNFPFINERLVSTVIDMKGYRSAAYPYTADTLADKYKPYLGDLQALSNLKMLINVYESDEIYQIWNYYRTKFLNEHQGVLNLE